MKVKQIEYHRNGVSGNGFFVVKFSDFEDKQRNFIGIVFDEPGDCAVFDADLLAEGNITFGQNSWRGGRFESRLRKAIEEYIEQRA
jgi:hypothetical protein